MCFTTETRKFKIAEKPIRVYKWIYKNRRTPFQNYMYHKGLNVPKSTVIESTLGTYSYCYLGGVLHCYKNKCEPDLHRIVIMYVPVGAEYNDEGCGGSSNELISTALYWPKNIFEHVWYYLHSKKY